MQNATEILAALAKAFDRMPKGCQKFLAVSGGVDSMVLLEAARRLGATNVTVVHVNHGLRGRESDGDEALVRDTARTSEFSFRSVQLKWGGETPSQAACRKKRDEFFASLSKPGDKIFLAHHQDDQAETVFLRLLRGTGLDGLGAMAEVSGNKVRPLLGFTREEILTAAKAWNLRWREDSSNRSSKYERNWLRNEIFPLLEERRPGFSRRLADLAAEARALPAPEEGHLFSSLGFRFAQREHMLELGERGLKRIFTLDRIHTAKLMALLRKGSGQCSSAGARFRLSQGVLLVESGQSFCDALFWKNESRTVRIAESALGAWIFRDSLGEIAGDRAAFAAGEKGKKEFQEAGVPLFFRDSLPVLRREGKITFPMKGASGLEFRPSALGQWWINSCAGHGGPAAPLSK